jgi:hypothetical protein
VAELEKVIITMLPLQVLNHVLKNSVAEAASLIELELSRERETQNLKSALERLYRTMSWCASRQVMVDLSSGKYRSTHTTVIISKFLGIVASTDTTLIDNTPLATRQEEFEIAFDEKLALLAVENAKTNAISHGDDHGITISADFKGKSKLKHLKVNPLKPFLVSKFECRWRRGQFFHRVHREKSPCAELQGH